MYARCLKRMLDFFLAGLGLVVLAPILLVVILAIRLEDGGPALFRQKRVGRHGRIFELLKFRTMTVDCAEVTSDCAVGMPRTRVGKYLRRLNIDELPQLVNVLRGEMSLVGPRPALPTQEELCRMRAESGAAGCRPGVTGLAQVSAYDGMPDEEKAARDAEYHRQVSFGTDLRILLRTVTYLRKTPPVY